MARRVANLETLNATLGRVPVSEEPLKERVPPWMATAFYYGTRPWVWMLLKLWKWGTERKQVGPFLVFADALDPGEERKISEAADLIRERDPLWNRRVSTYIRELLLADHNGGLEGEYHPRARAVLIKRDVMPKVDAPSLAALLIHEATHGHLHAARVRTTVGSLKRVERICLKNEIRFLRNAGGFEALALAKEERFRSGNY